MDETGNDYEAEMIPLFKIYIGEIIIDDTTSVTIFGYLPGDDENELLRCDFVCKMHQLTDMLLQAGAEGESLINIISEGLANDFDGLLRVNAENLFGKPVEVDGIVLIVYEAREKNEHGEYVIPNDFFYMIDNLQTMDDFMENGIRVAEYIAPTPEEELEDAIVSLLNSYKHYLRLLDGGDTEVEARQGAALADETLFELATLYYQTRIKKPGN